MSWFVFAIHLALPHTDASDPATRTKRHAEATVDGRDDREEGPNEQKVVVRRDEKEEGRGETSRSRTGKMRRRRGARR